MARREKHGQIGRLAHERAGIQFLSRFHAAHGDGSGGGVNQARQLARDLELQRLGVFGATIPCPSRPLRFR